MKELKCPACGHVFNVDPDTYESLANQVKTAEFEAEVQRRTSEVTQRLKAEERAERATRESQIRILEQRLQEAERLHRTETRIEVDKKEREMAEKLAEREREITELRGTLARNDSERRLAVMEQQKKTAEELRAKEAEIAELRARSEADKREASMREAGLKEHHAMVLRQKDETIEYYKDLKARMSTKMVGETLEIHCQVSFQQAQSMGLFPDAKFSKDNDASGGSKGDFIFRDFDEGHEYISIMFEMKNENETTATKHRNEDFFEKLNKDRNEKGCEYAVLVSMLERDNDLYNDGIVNVSHRYPKMYVIRPQMFVPLISLLSQASRKCIREMHALRVELEVARAQSVDVTNFEARRDRFVESFGKLVGAHRQKQVQALENIDKVIATLEKQIASLRSVKALFEDSTQKLERANSSIETDFSIKHLVHGNRTMREKFDQARRLRDASTEE